MAIKLVHVADIHFGMENYGRLDPETGLNTRLIDFRNAFNYVIDQALQMKADLMVFAGDAYRSRDPSQTHQREFATCIRRLTENGIPVVLLVGNHDLPNSAGRATALEIFRTLGVENVIVADKPEIHTIKTKSGSVQVAALPWVTKSHVMTRDEYKNMTLDQLNDVISRKCSEIIRNFAENVNPKIPAVLTCHASVNNARLSTEQNIMIGQDLTLMLADLTLPAFDYVALGHIHQFQNLNPSGNPPVIYSGSIERVDFSEEKEEKGFVVVNLSTRKTTYEFREIPTRKFLTIRVDADVSNPTEEILDAIQNHEIKDAVVRLIYEISEHRVHQINEKKIMDALNAAHYVAPIVRQITQREFRIRQSQLTEELGPMQALKMYLETQDNIGKDRSEKLRQAASELIKKVQEEQDVYVPN